MNLSNEKIAILAGGPSCEREVSLISGRAVEEALGSRGIRTVFVDPDPAGAFVETLRREAVSAVFLALHGTFGEDGTVQTLLEKAGIPYTGSGPEASRAAFDKSLSQTLFRRAGLRVADFRVFERGRPAAAPFSFPLVVKPACAGSSVGVTIVHEPAGYEAALAEAFKWSERVLVEQFVAGRELTVGILGDKPLPVVEIVARREFYDYQAKYQNTGTEYRVPADLPEAVRQTVQHLAVSAYRELGSRVMARADIILDVSGRPYLLEVNTIPGLTGRSLLPKAAGAAGIDFPGLCVRILELSLAATAAQ